MSQRRAARHLVETFFERSEEHTSELQSRLHLVCRLLLEKKKKAKQHSQSSSPQLPLREMRHSALTRQVASATSLSVHQFLVGRPTSASSSTRCLPILSVT